MPRGASIAAKGSELSIAAQILTEGGDAFAAAGVGAEEEEEEE
jgi:hypothetical protein